MSTKALSKSKALNKSQEEPLSIAIFYREMEEAIKQWQRLMAGIHPREQQPLVCLLKFIDELLTKPELLEGKLLWVIPVFNVDGKLYDDAGTGKEPRDWRKNRRKNSDGTVGVDLNRNFGVRWGGFRAIDPTWRVPTTQPSANIYEGTAPFSEPETRALAKFIQSRRNLRAFLDIHSPLREILHPAYLIPEEAERFSRIAQGMQARQTDSPYPITQPKIAQDPPNEVRVGNTGLTYTWAYYTQGVYGFNLEISIPSKKTGLSGRYPSKVTIKTEYINNVREPLLYFLAETAKLPEWREQKITHRGAWRCEPSVTSGAIISVLPPDFGLTTGFGVLVSETANAVVQSEYRLYPWRSGFTVEIQKNVKIGTKLPFTLYLWDDQRQRHVEKTVLIVM
jgi:hypothetical protein